MLLSILLLGLLASPSGTAPPSRMTLKDGRVFDLKDLPLAGRRIVFTTTDGKVYSMDETEVVTISIRTPPTPPSRTYNPQDSRALGAIARQQRNRKGISTILGGPRSPARRNPRRTPVRPPAPRPGHGP